jgi:hypothetical protein
VLIGGLTPGAAAGSGAVWLRVVNAVPGGELHQSHLLRSVPGMWPAAAGEWEVRRTGDWAFLSAGAGSPPPGWWRTPATSGPPTATATWTAPVEVSGAYDVEYTLFPGAGAFTAVYQVRTPRTNVTVRINHPGAASVTGKLATDLWLRRGERPEVVLNNQVSGGTAPLATGRVRWVYRDGQDPPPAATLPAWWTEHFFPGAASGDAGIEAEADADADGASNFAEFVCGTDPTEAGSRLGLRLEPAAEGGWQAVFAPLTPGRRYVLERTGAVAAGPWEVVPGSGPLSRPPGEGVLRDAAPDAETRFYRLRVSAW